MGPLKKRMRKDPAEAEEIKPKTKTVPSLADLQILMKRMLDQVQVQGSSEVGALSNDLLTLKDWQRSLFESNAEQESALETHASLLHKRQRALAALSYERAHLQGLIQACQTYATPNLLQLATDELHQETTSLTTSTDMTEEQKQTAFAQFLGPNVNVNDPTKKQHIIARLHQELNRRGTLARDVKLKRQELEKIKAELANKRQILDSLPDQLSVMERASKPLQKFFGLQLQQQNSTTTSTSGSTSTTTTADQQSLRMIGTERRARLDLARSLPAPLYTLFQQLQQYMDVEQQQQRSSHGGTGVTVSVGGDKETPADQQQVLLQLPVPDVSTGALLSSTLSTLTASASTTSTTVPASTSTVRHKRVTIHFYCYTHPAVKITAVASGCGSTLNQDVLLDELFPHDSPKDDTNTNTSIEDVQGRPYHWCNYLAGLHLVDKDCLPASTRVIVRELQRRIRANATLKYVLQALQRKTMPTPPGMDKTTTTTQVKLVSFVLSKDKETTTTTQNSSQQQQTYNVTLRKGPANLKVKVQIHVSRYPAVPPVWSLNTSGEDDTDTGDNNNTSSNNNILNPLYDDRLALLERQVNLQALETFVTPDQEETYDWILVRQLREVMQEWEGWLDADNSNSNSNNGSSNNASGSDNASRKRKGRDRAPVSTSS